MPTTNPVPSTDPSDLLFNAGKLDEVVNGAANSFTDRLGATRRTVAGMNADFDAQLADAESDLNVYRADAAASAAEALGYLQTIRTTSYGAYASDPATDPLGNPPTEGDEYWNTTAKLLKRWNGSTWQASDINTANLAASSGSSLVGYDGGTVQDVLDAVTGPSGAASVGYTPAGTGAVATTTGLELDKIVYVTRFGASPTASASDNTSAIQEAADYAKSIGAKLIGVPGTYNVNGTITIQCHCDLTQMVLSAPGASMTGPVIFVGRNDSSPTSGIDVKLPRVVNSSATPSTWTGAGSYPGVEVGNLYHSTVLVNYITGFVVGFDCGGYSYGCALNTFSFLSYLQNNKIGFRGKPKAAAGWMNDNLFIAPNVRVDSNYGNEVAGVINIQLAPFDITNGIASWPNNNVFIKPVIEGVSPKYHLEIAGADNTFINPRLETGDVSIKQKVNYVGHASITKTIRNLILGGYSSSDYVFTSSGIAGGNGLSSAVQNTVQQDSVRPCFSLVNNSSSANPAIRVYPAGQNPLELSNSNTVWTVNQSSTSTQYKATGDPFARVSFDHANGFVSFGDGTVAPTKSINGASSGLRVSSDWWPSSDNTRSLGFSSLRWTTVYAATGTINTSDAREKQQIRPISDAEMSVAIKLKSLVKAFKFNDSVLEKGDAARIHVGVIAQDVKAAFESEGLIAEDYAILCYDEWDGEQDLFDESGNVVAKGYDAGSRYGVRYEELLAFIISAL